MFRFYTPVVMLVSCLRVRACVRACVRAFAHSGVRIHVSLSLNTTRETKAVIPHVTNHAIFIV